MINFNTTFLCCIICLGAAVSVPAQKNLNNNTSQARMYHDISILASDSLRGREAGTPDEQMAADYISKQMTQIGLLPKGDKEGSFLSEFRMSYPVIFKNAKLQVGDVIFKHVEEFGATDLSSPGNVAAQLVNIGKGQGSDLKGKIALIDISNGWKNEANSIVLSDIIARITQITNQGAVGVILHNSSRKPIEDVLFGSPFTESFSVPVVYIARLPYNKIRNIETAECTLMVEIDRTISKPVNLIGWINNQSAKTVIIGGHFDHLGITKGKGTGPEPQIHNGADDNASGIAALLEIARWAVHNENLKYNYMFVAFSAEEKGLFGSKAFCSRDWVNNDNIAYMLNLDMVGRLGCQGDTLSALGIASSPAWEELINKLEHPDFSIKKINGAPPFSDHSPFVKKKIPVIYFTTGLHPEYHTPKDDTELINISGMTEIVSYIRQYILAAEALPAIPFHSIGPLQNTKALIQTF